MEPVEQAVYAGTRAVNLGGPAAGQPRYQTLPALMYPDGTVLTEWVLSEAERLAIAHGENIRLWVWTFGHPFQPVKLELTSEDRG